MSDHTFCRLMLHNARTDAKKVGIKVPTLSSWRDGKEDDCWIELHDDTKMVWQGTAHCVYDAKANYIFSLIPEEFYDYEE